MRKIFRFLINVIFFLIFFFIVFYLITWYFTSPFSPLKSYGEGIGLLIMLATTPLTIVMFCIYLYVVSRYRRKKTEKYSTKL